MQPDCCIVGAGPAGAMLALLLARQGVKVILLEAHDDFNREFRGDTLHPSTLEILDQIDLAAPLLRLPHQKIQRAVFSTRAGSFFAAEFQQLKSKFPFVALMPQSRFLEFITSQAKQYESFQLRMGANVRELLRTDGQVVGVTYDHDDRQHEVRAPLVVACDGRFSRLRKQSQLPVEATSPPMDVLWFRLPKRAGEPRSELTARVAAGHILVVLPRDDHDQLGYFILKGSYREVRDAGLDAFKASLIAIAPFFRGRVDALRDWHQIAPLSVESNCLKRWYLPGLLLIGDAAHAMSPVAGVGINYAIQDAVATANILGPKLLAGALKTSDLALVQKRRGFPTKFIQRFQTMIQKRIVRVALDSTKQFQPPWFMRLPLVRRLPTRLIAYGVRPERIASVPTSVAR